MEGKRERKHEYNHYYYQNNKARFLMYNQRDHEVKMNRIKNWRRIGVDRGYDFEIIYDIYINTTACDLCGITFTNGKGARSKCLDHNHETGEIRNIVCMTCNNSTHLRHRNLGT